MRYNIIINQLVAIITDERDHQGIPEEHTIRSRTEHPKPVF